MGVLVVVLEDVVDCEVDDVGEGDWSRSSPESAPPRALSVRGEKNFSSSRSTKAEEWADDASVLEANSDLGEISSLKVSLRVNKPR